MPNGPTRPWSKSNSPSLRDFQGDSVKFTFPNQNLLPVSADMNNSTFGVTPLSAPVSTTFSGISTVSTASGSV
ncbi:Uncharacterised protein [Mycobacteroides abscessus subsp. abscessus]|nr:Uncharacterised protein [Mycobacteroides abscessus subsp. abscessus]SHT47948.1 Uncharacterised protein [Mycobacteroides abscessus subsp. abscessus]SHU11847.1 Uncharacterised protein [Mycobacteroides abscessus subsp. abscessus]